MQRVSTIFQLVKSKSYSGEFKSRNIGENYLCRLRGQSVTLLMYDEVPVVK